jgi:hypothetical protein
MMESHRQLNHPLEMPPQRFALSHSSPNVLKGLVGVEKVRAVKQL